MIECGPRLQRGDGIDQIRHRFGLDEIDAAVEKCPQRKLAGLGEPCAGIDGALNNLSKHDRAAMCADFDAVFAGVGVRSGKVGRDYVIAGCSRERRISRPKGSIEDEQFTGDRARGRTAETNNANAAPSRRRRDGDDRIVHGKHVIQLGIQTGDQESLESLLISYSPVKIFSAYGGNGDRFDGRIADAF